jgi:hypothetical protein
MTPRLTQRSVSLRKRNLIGVLALLLSAGLLLAALSAWQNWFWFSGRIEGLSVGLPGALAESQDTYAVEASAAAALENRMNQLLLEQDQLAAWYRLAGRTGQPPAERSTAALALDQVRYGQFLLEQGDRKRFLAWWEGYRDVWLNDEGGSAGNLEHQADAPAPGTADWFRVNLLLARLLTQSCTLWPEQQQMEDLVRLSDLILTDLDHGIPTDQTAVVPTAGPILDPGATPSPRPTAAPTPAADAGIRLDVLRLASIDLFAMQSLIQVDEAWQPIYDRCLAVVLNGYLGDAMPLYAWAWQPQSDGYLPFQGDQPVIDTEEAILTILHLCEVGQVPQRSISWIREQLYNHSALYVSYHTGQGTATDQRECLPAYAMVARIARIIRDEPLYRSAVSRLLWHQATSQTSPARSAIFREEPDGAIFIWARDNVWALLALR